MSTLIKLALPLLALAMFGGVYVIKVETWQLQREAKKLERQIENEQRSIIELRAEWAYLTRPERIEKLARKHLKMRPPKPEQITVLRELALRNIADNPSGCILFQCWE